ncbi:outer membrane efflux protein [Desulfosporosinus acididurans]|uniref:Outer membrane efflux protein n=1 Tax=Desulfosporosinus acididurans TaxID=476652 RepID=A0A0J1FLJ5_9FIRM|nr:TolC family protein [Desulfosporosinus acididurans]KLU64350.1 outer membrane efflux protein [Desulfosporosinus acididurans]
MKKKYLSIFAFVPIASMMLFTNSTLALDNTTQPTSGASTTSTAVSATSTSTTSTTGTSATSTTGTSATSTTGASTTSTTGASTTSTTGASATSTSDSSATTGTSGTSTTSADTSTLNLSLDDALKMVETGNSTIKLDDSEIQILDRQNQEALARHSANAPVVDEDSKKDLDLNYKRSQWNLDNEKHQRDTDLKDAKVRVTNEYEDILNYQQEAQNYQTQLTNLATQIDKMNLQIKLGLQIPSAVDSLNAAKSGLEAKQKGVLNSSDSEMLSLKQDLGIDLGRNVVLTSSLIPYTKFDDSDLDNKIAQAIQNNYDLKKYQEDIDISQIEYSIDKVFEDTMSADQVELSIEDKKATLANISNNQLVQLRTDYNSLKSLENTIAAAQLTVEADKINIDVMQKNIDAGKSTILDMITLQNALLNDQFTLQQDINQYMTDAANFQNSLDD